MNNRVITTRHVDIIEEDIKLIGFNENENQVENISEISENESYQSIPDKYNNSPKNELRRSERNKKPNPDIRITIS